MLHEIEVTRLLISFSTTAFESVDIYPSRVQMLKKCFRPRRTEKIGEDWREKKEKTEKKRRNGEEKRRKPEKER